MVGIARVAVLQMDHSAHRETVFGEDVLHYAVVAVRVDPDDVASLRSDILERPIEHPACDIAAGGVSRHSVDRVIRLIVRLCAAAAM